jgi:hypothetical protein
MRAELFYPSCFVCTAQWFTAAVMVSHAGMSGNQGRDTHRSRPGILARFDSSENLLVWGKLGAGYRQTLALLLCGGR